MLNKSALLTYLLERADKLRQEDGKSSLSANYFMISLLQTVSARDSGELPGELKGEETRRELAEASALLRAFQIDAAKTASNIAKAIRSDSYNSTMEGFLFGKISYTAEARAKKEGKSVVDVCVYLSMILEEPTEAIKDFVLSMTAQGTEDTNGDATNKPEEDDFSLLIEEIERKMDEEERKPENPMSGIERLSKTVDETKKIQDMLLASVFGQDHAVESFVSGYFQSQLMAHSRKEVRKPQATFLFAGPPGVGKTFLAEKAAESLDLPFMRFDMSEYSDKEANIEFCGSDKVYKNGKAGNVTSFVSENPHCVLLFDEIEKAHINVIYLFLQILDAGRIRDNYTDEEVSFSQAVLIFTTNVGKNLYEDPTAPNLATLPRKKILKALASDKDPSTGVPLFPAAICSRFASGNVVMFNHLDANNLFSIAKRELENNVKSFEASTGIRITVADEVPSAIMFAEGGKADARTVKGRANSFFHDELYELFRLLASAKVSGSVEKLQEIRLDVSLEGAGEDITGMFVNAKTPEVLIFAEEKLAKTCETKLKNIVCHVANSVEDAKNILFNHDISVVLCDVMCQAQNPDLAVINIEDVQSAGHDFLTYLAERYSLPIYLLQESDGAISYEELLSFAKLGVRGALTVSPKKDDFCSRVQHLCTVAYQQESMFKLARESKVLSYKTAQTVSKNKKTANIHLFNFRLALSTDLEDSKSILDNVSKPSIHFEDVIGAEDAKGELSYFVEYLKDPVKYMRMGVRAPKGVLLYGPPGTGKTLLAKAMAGESDVTFLVAEGNQFLKRFVGEGATAVHDLFNAARKYAPSILFIDEIDAIGKNRNSQSSSADLNSDVLTAFLTEMDGFNTDTTKPVFVLAATNYDVEPGGSRSLDPALLRRFDRRICVDLPKKNERKRYIEMKVKQNATVQLSSEQIDNIAIRSTGMSLADLESVFEMALRNAIRSKTGVVGDAEFEDAFETFNSGAKKAWSKDELRQTACHEAGHALMCWLSGDMPSYVTIVARASHGGYMQHGDNEDKGTYKRAELLGRVRTALGGRAAEVVYYGEEDGLTTGASGDLYSATRTVERMICNYGMDKTMGMAYVQPDSVSSDYYSQVRARVNEILAQEMETTIRMISEHKEIMDKLIEALMDKNYLNEAEMRVIFGVSPKA